MKTLPLLYCVAVLMPVCARAGEMVDDVSRVWETYEPTPDAAWPSPNRNLLTDREKSEGFALLFNGQDLSGWKAAENPDTFFVADGALVAKGKRAHLFYVGPVNGANFTNFHFKTQVLTKPGSNSGIYFHTACQEHGWPRQGYEAQVNNTHQDKRKTGSLYDVKDNHAAVAQDHAWFLYEILVRDNTIEIKIDGKPVTTFTEPADHNVKGRPRPRLSSGTFAIQGHDPGSEVHYRAIRVKPLP